MAAYFESGFSVREPMWHGLGTIADRYPEDWNEARQWAGLMWEPELRPLSVARAMNDAELAAEVAKYDWAKGALDAGWTPPGAWEIAEDKQAVVRPDTGLILGVVGEEYGLLTHDEMGQIVDAVLGADGNARFETAGSVREGRQVWVLVRLDEPFTAPGDDSETYPFLVLLNSHDGSGACKVAYVHVRVVCWNTFNQADAEATRHGRQFSFRHVGKPMERIEDAKEALNGLRKATAEYLEMIEGLVTINVDDTFLEHFLSEFIPKDPSVQSERVQANVDKARGVFRHLFMEAVTVPDAHRGNAAGLLDASTEYLDHVRGYQNRDTYLGRSMLRPESHKAKSLAIVRRLAGIGGN